MLALVAAIVFGIGFLLVLFGVALPVRFNLLYLGLTLLALHFVFDLPSPLLRGRRRGRL